MTVPLRIARNCCRSWRSGEAGILEFLAEQGALSAANIKEFSAHRTEQIYQAGADPIGRPAVETWCRSAKQSKMKSNRQTGGSTDI